MHIGRSPTSPPRPRAPSSPGAGSRAAVGGDAKADPVIAAAVSVAVEGDKTRFSVTMSSRPGQVQLMEGPTG